MTLSEFIEKHKHEDISEEIILSILMMSPKKPEIKMEGLSSGQKYYYIVGDGTVEETIWYWDNQDNDIFKLGNIFLKKEDAMFIIEKLKITVELRRFAKEYNIGEASYYITYNENTGYLGVGHTEGWKSLDTIYFSTKEIAQKAIDTISADRIKKYFY